MKEIKMSGFRIPEDMAVVGFDNISFSCMSDPALTTISQPQFDLGYKAVELLLKRIKSGYNDPEHIFLEHELVIRESTVR
jgi:LacI family repressor for deo operon, udp, cdd, tsx, nupC, and nupG